MKTRINKIIPILLILGIATQAIIGCGQHNFLEDLESILGLSSSSYESDEYNEDSGSESKALSSSSNISSSSAARSSSSNNVSSSSAARSSSSNRVSSSSAARSSSSNRVSSSSTASSSSSESNGIRTFELKVLELTNIERARQNLPPLIWHDVLASVARAHSEDMIRNNFVDHTGSDGSTLGDRLDRANILYATGAENVAAGQLTPDKVVEGWMNSPGHKANILNSSVTHLGVGYVPRPSGSSANYASYWTQVFCKFR